MPSSPLFIHHSPHFPPALSLFSLHRCLHPSEPVLEVTDLYWHLKDSVARYELLLLRVLRFDVNIAMPHPVSGRGWDFVFICPFISLYVSPSFLSLFPSPPHYYPSSLFLCCYNSLNPSSSLLPSVSPPLPLGTLPMDRLRCLAEEPLALHRLLPPSGQLSYHPPSLPPTPYLSNSYPLSRYPLLSTGGTWKPPQSSAPVVGGVQSWQQ